MKPRKMLWLLAALSITLLQDCAYGPAVPVGRTPDPPSADGVDPLNATYRIDGREVRLVNGRAVESVAPSVKTKTKIVVCGQPVYGDLDGDGQRDAALLLVLDPGGSGTFYYAAAARYENGTYRGTNAVFLGDRIAPQEVAIRDGILEVSYAERRPDEPMSTPPSVGRTMHLILRNGALVNLPTSGFFPPRYTPFPLILCSHPLQ